MITIKKPALHSIPKAKYALGGELQRRLDAVTEQWILPTPFANPAILEMFRNRDRKPYQDQVNWAGEFAGKYLTHAIQIYRLTRNPVLARHIAWFIKEFISLQADDGYLGSWPEPWRLRRGAPNCAEPWDAWGHYHAMLGLLLWHQETGDRAALKCVRRMADLMCRRFMDGKPERMHDAGAHEMNQAPIHTLAWLYRLTGEKRYLDMARTIEREFEIPPAGDYIRTALAGQEFYQTPKPRWESLHPIMGLVELFYATGEEKYRQAFEHLWWSMLKGDRHNNGGFTSGEQATGNPYHSGAIETCCTVAWMAMSVEMLKLTGQSVVADELELAMFNSGLGMMSPSGRWVTYDTPMDGQRCASAHTIVFQSLAGSPELNCCSVNGPRALGMACEWAVMQKENGLVVNYYGPGKTEAALLSGNSVTLEQDTDYPRHKQVVVRVKPRKSEDFPLFFRIPAWSEKTTVSLNGKAIRPVTPGQYLEIRRQWRTGDTIKLVLDFRPHFWCGALEAKDLDLTWKLFGPVPRRAEEMALPHAPPRYPTEPDWVGLTAVPSTLVVNGTSYDPVEIRSKDGIIACRDLFPDVGGQPTAFAFAELEVAEAQELTLYFSADWWIAWSVNGEKVFDNHATNGNGGDLMTRPARHHKVTFHVRKGRNMLAFRLSGGTGRGCWLTAGRGLLNEEQRANPTNRDYQASMYQGPILLAVDPRYQDSMEEFKSVFDGKTLSHMKQVEPGTWLKPWMLFEVKDTAGNVIRLCDYGSAGMAGNSCRSWLRVQMPIQPADTFSRENPLRSVRP